MARKILAGGFLLLIGGLGLGVAVAQVGEDAGGAKYMSHDAIEKGIQAEISKGGGTLGAVAGYTVPVAGTMVVRRRLEGKNNASIHSTATDGQDYTEVMEVIGGSGTFMTGGHFVDDNPVYNKKERDKGIVGGVTHEVHVGDIFVIPPGTAHWFPKINKQVTIVETRFPGNALEGGKKKKGQ